MIGRAPLLSSDSAPLAERWMTASPDPPADDASLPPASALTSTHHPGSTLPQPSSIGDSALDENYPPFNDRHDLELDSLRGGDVQEWRASVEAVPDGRRAPPPPPAHIPVPAPSSTWPAHATESTARTPKKRTLLAFKRAVSGPALTRADKQTATGKRSSTTMVGGLLRSLTGKTVEDKMEKARIEQVEADAKASRIHHRVASMMGPSTGEPRPLSGSYVSSSSLVGATDSASASAARTRYSESPTDSDLGYSSILSSLAGSPPRLTSEPMQAAWGERAGQVDPFTPAPTLADSHDGARIRPGLAVSVPAPDLFTQIRFRQVSMSVYPEQQTPAAAHAAHHLSSPVSEYSLDGCDEDESGVVNHRTRQQSISNRSSVHDGSTLGYPTDSPSTPGMPSTPPDSPTDSVAPLMVASSRRSTASSSERSWSIRSGSPPGEQQQRAHYQTTQQRQASQHPRKAVNPKMHSLSEVATKVAEAGKDEETFFM